MNALERVREFRGWMSTRIKGQPELLERMDGCFARGELGLTDPNYARGAYMLAGPTGVGKTESTLCGAEFFFGAGAVAKLNMSEYKEARSAAELRLRLTTAQAEGKQVFLFDEIEKAHWEVLDLLLQMLDRDAVLSGANGEPVSFTKAYIVLTTNLGAREAMRSRTSNYELYQRTIAEYVRRYMRPEILGRINFFNGVVVLRRLAEPQQRELAQFHLRGILRRMGELGYQVEVGERAFEYFIRNGFSEEYGARNLIGMMRASVEGAIAEALRAGVEPNGCLAVRSDGRGLGIVGKSEIAA